jgi:hypothetical protein
VSQPNYPATATHAAGLARQVFRVAPEVVWRDAPGEIVLFNSGSETYHVLSPSAAEIWRLLAAGLSAEGAATELCKRFDADHGEMLSDVCQQVSGLLERGLLVP